MSADPQSHLPSTPHRLPVAKPARTRAARAYRSSSSGEPYVPGRFDVLLAPRDHTPADQLVGVTFEVSGFGLSLIATEHTTTGATPRHLVNAFPYYVDMRLPDGREVTIEARVYAPAPEPKPRKRKATTVPAVALEPMALYNWRMNEPNESAGGGE